MDGSNCQLPLAVPNLADPSLGCDAFDPASRQAKGPLKNVRGALFMLAGMFVFAAVDAQAKYLTDHVPALQIVWLRQIGLVIGVLLLIAYRGRGILKTDSRGLQIARGVKISCGQRCELWHNVAIRHTRKSHATERKRPDAYPAIHANRACQRADPYRRAVMA